MLPRAKPVTDQTAWTAAELAADTRWIRHFTADELTELDARLQRVRNIPVTQIAREDFPLDAVSGTLEKASKEIHFGRGLMVLRGLPVERYSKEDAARIYWGIGLHLGTPVTQNRQAELLGHVKDEGVTYSQRTRGYYTRAKLSFHTDNCDIVGLLCLRTSKSGGLSRFASSTTIFNRMLKTRPELLKPLFDGFYFDLKGEQRPGAGELSDHKIPVFSDRDGFLSCRYLRNAIEPAFIKSGEAKTEAQEQALNLYDRLADSAELCFDMRFEPGDMQLLNNHVIVHSRTAFEDFDEEDRKRHLLRLWLRNDTRPLAHEFAERFGPGTARMGVPDFGRERPADLRMAAASRAAPLVTNPATPRARQRSL